MPHLSSRKILRSNSTDCPLIEELQMSAKENADYLMQYAQHGITDPKELANVMGQMQVALVDYPGPH